MRAVENYRVGAEFGGEFIVNVSHGEFAGGRRIVVQNTKSNSWAFFFFLLLPHRRRMTAVAMTVGAESCSRPTAAASSLS